MLIYVNQFELVGPNHFSAATSAISGWLKTVTKKHFTTEMLLSGEEFTIGKTKVRTYTATAISPALYSILLSHPDRSVKGRQWITEIGIKYDGDTTTVSILLETSDISTLVKDIPATTRPRLVSFLIQNGQINPEKTIGLRVQHINNETDSFKALSYEIERQERDYPLVLVSNCKADNKPLVNPYKLQEQLVGLAQVVCSDDEIDSWELKNVLTRKYSAWDGAINIIYPTYGKGYFGNRLILRDSLNEIKTNNDSIIQHILSYITHTTNGYNKKQHFGPTDVRAKRQKDSRVQLKERFAELSSDSEYKSLAEEAFAQLEEQENVMAQLKERHESDVNELMHLAIETQEQLDESKRDYQVLKLRFSDLQQTSSKKGRPLIVSGKEQEKYKGEVVDLLLDIIEEQAISTPPKTRKKHLLDDILNNNSAEGTRSKYIEELKQIFSNYTGLTNTMNSSLKALGLEVISDGNHNQLRFIGDGRHKVTFAKTPSDKRVGSNIIRDVKSALL